jgi:hypothetical protein
MNDFGLQNVVSRILVYQGEKLDVGDVVERLKWASSSTDSSSYLTDEAMDRILLQIRTKALALVLLEPSCGAELVALCANVTESNLGK